MLSALFCECFALTQLQGLHASNPELGFPTILLRGVLLTQGLWYYEITVPKYQEGFCAQIGWVDLHYFQEVCCCMVHREPERH